MVGTAGTDGGTLGRMLGRFAITSFRSTINPQLSHHQLLLSVWDVGTDGTLNFHPPGGRKSSPHSSSPACPTNMSRRSVLATAEALAAAEVKPRRVVTWPRSPAYAHLQLS